MTLILFQTHLLIHSVTMVTFDVVAYLASAIPSLQILRAWRLSPDW